MNPLKTIPTLQDITLREESWCEMNGTIMAVSSFGGSSYVRDLEGADRSILVHTSDLDFVTPGADFDYAIGLVHSSEGFRGYPDYNLISVDPKTIQEFLKRASLTRGFSIQYAINTSRGVVVEVMKTGKLTLKIIKMMLDLGFDQWFYSNSWAPRVFLLKGTVVPVCATFDLTTGSEVNPWLKALWGREIPGDSGYALTVHFHEYLERMKV